LFAQSALLGITEERGCWDAKTLYHLRAGGNEPKGKKLPEADENRRLDERLLDHQAETMLY
jgi:hypothetical protein